MSDQTQAAEIPENAPEAPVDAEAEALAQAIAEEDSPQETEDDSAELEIGSEKVKVPKVVKGAWDGLQKSIQTRAEELKAEKAAVASERQRTQEFQQIVAAVSDDLAELKGLDKQIEPYMKLTPAEWMAWTEQDPDAARKAQMGVQAMLMQRQQLAGKIQTKAQEAEAKQKAAKDEYRKSVEAKIKAEIVDWSPAQKEVVLKAAEEYGIRREEVEDFLDPRHIRIIRDAAAYRAAKARVAAKSAPNTPAPQPQPSIRPRGTTDSSGLSDRVPMEQWNRNFLKSLRNR